MNVSIIIPIYNVESYIGDCLRSVMNQTYTGEMECLLVDDCGQDRSMEIAEKMVASYENDPSIGPGTTSNENRIQFRILHHEKNRGLSAARNTGIRAAQGDYLYFLDSDDTISADCISSLWTMVEKHPGVECVFAGAKSSVEGWFLWMDYNKKDFPEYSDDRDWIQESMLQRYPFSMTAVNRLISTEFVKTNNLYFEEGYFHEDDLWNLAISQHIQNAAFVCKNTYNYICREKSIIAVATGDMQLKLDRHLRLWNKMLSNVSGYRKEIQPYYISIAAQEDFQLIHTVNDYLRMTNILLKAIMKSNIRYAISITHILLILNKKFCKRIIRKWLL